MTALHTTDDIDRLNEIVVINNQKTPPPKKQKKTKQKQKQNKKKRKHDRSPPENNTEKININKQADKVTANLKRIPPIYNENTLKLVLSPLSQCSPMIQEDGGSIPGRFIPKTLKMVLDVSLLNTQHEMLWIKGEWSNPGK